jgi:outer membrane protein assembly factor BamB
MLVTDNSLYIGDKYGNVSEIMISSGKVRWKAVTGAEIISVTKVKQGLLVSSFDNFIYLLSEKNGKRLWKKRLTGKSIGKPLIKDNVAVFCTLGGSDALFIELDKGKSVNKVLINDENYFINNPSSFNNLIFFPTLKGLIAFSSDKQCSNK